VTKSETNQQYDSKFHRWYVGGEGEIAEKPAGKTSVREYGSMTFEEILEEYRRYVGDKTAQLPDEVLEKLRVWGKV